MAQALLPARVLLESGFAHDRAVLFEDGCIVDIVSTDDPRAADAQPLRGLTLLPGFIDCQVNGGGDVLFNDAPDVATIARIGAAHARFGTTGFLPTLISDDLAVMRAAIDAVDAAIEQGVPGVLGVHLEGPFLSPERRGVHDAEKFFEPGRAELDLVASLRRGRSLLTLAPERVGVAAIADLTARGVIVAAGHTAANYTQTRAALDAGLRGFTHLYNAMSPLTSREPGVVGAALEDHASWCGLIVDGFHAHPASFRVALAAKPRGKLFLVTDAMPPVGGVCQEFRLGDRVMICRDGRCTAPDGTLAGSALDMASAARNTVLHLGVSLAEAARMAATYPADFLGLSDRGRIAPGCVADFVAVDDALAVQQTWIAGRSVYARHA
jgi:N-acetylglucosamine-6-phosphate deacetylase